MLTAKGKYALKALIYLSTLEPGEKAQGLAIAKAGNIPKKFLDAILGELRGAGVVYTMTVTTPSGTTAPFVFAVQ